MRPRTLILPLLVLTVACAAPPDEDLVVPEETATAVEPYDADPAPLVARVTLTAAEGQTATGEVVFTESGDGVLVQATVEGAEPGPHGFHLHETGDCSAPDFTSSGGHFNPAMTEHAGPEAEARHAGDFGNLEVGEDGSGSLELTSSLLTVSEGDHSVVGRAVILHGGEDDLTSQPSGAAGPRIACGVVALAGDEDEMAAEETDDVPVADQGAI